MLEILPTELLGLIAENAGKNSYVLWLYFPAIRPTMRGNWRAFVDRLELNSMITTKLFGLLHSVDDAPAWIDYHVAAKRPKFVGWYDRGVLHRGNDQPAYIDVHHHDVAWHIRDFEHADSRDQCGKHKQWRRPGVVKRCGGLPEIMTRWGPMVVQNNYNNLDRFCVQSCGQCQTSTTVYCQMCYGNADHYVNMVLKSFCLKTEGAMQKVVS